MSNRKFLFIFLLVSFIIHHGYSQVKESAVKIVYQHPDLIKVDDIYFSKQHDYVVVARNMSNNIIYAFYRTANPGLIRSGKITTDDYELHIQSVSNDGNYFKLTNQYNDKLYGFYCISGDSITKVRPDKITFNESTKYIEEYWISRNFKILHNDDKVLLINQKTNEYRDFSNSVYQLKDSYYQQVQISPDGRYLGVLEKKSLKIYDTHSNQLVWTAPDRNFLNSGNFEFSIIDNILIFTNFDKSGKSMYLSWFDFINLKEVYSTRQQMFLSIPYISQIDNQVIISLGSLTKKRIQAMATINLATGRSTNLPNVSTYKEVQKVIKNTGDSIQKIHPERYSYIQDNRQFAFHWRMYHDKYFKPGGVLKDPALKCQVDYNFFDGIDDYTRNYTIFYALDNKATYQNTSNDVAFFGIVQTKKELLFWNDNTLKPSPKFVRMLYTSAGYPFFYCDDLYYFGNKELKDFVSFEDHGNIYPFEQFDLKYNRPDIILERLGYADSSLVNAYHEAYLKRLKKMNFTEDMLKDDFHLPEIKIENFQDLPLITDSNIILLNLNLNDSKYPIDRINLWINDVAVYGSNGISLRDKNAQSYKTSIPVNLAKGKNKIQVSVLNQAGVESYKETVEINCSKGKEKPDLYLITIGASKFQDTVYNLTYASKDATDIVELFSQNNQFGKIFSKTLINEQVTKENITLLSEFLSKADVNDEVIVFVAGHGVLDSKLDYYFASYDMDFSNPSEKGIAYEDIEKLLDGIAPLKKILLIDACHSGEIDKDEVALVANNQVIDAKVSFRAVGNSVAPKLGIQNTSELTKELFNDLRKGSGATVISSAGGMEFAMESGDWKNGLFTYCFLNGIQTKAADLNHDGEIWLSELQRYVSEQVTKLSNGKQQPTSRIENLEMDYRVW